MFSDREWELLRRVESDVVADDPEFARSFAAKTEKLEHSRPHHGPLWTRVAVVVAALLAGGMLLAGSPLGAVAVLVMAALVWVVWRYADDGTAGAAGTENRPIDPMM